MGLAVITVAAGGLPVKDLGGPGGIAVTEVTTALGGIAITKVTGTGAGMGVTFVSATGGPVAPAFATFDGAPTTAFITLSNGNLTVTRNTSSQSGMVSSTAFKNTGKYYFEIKNTLKQSGTANCIGIMLSGGTLADANSGLKCTEAVPAGATWIYSNNVDQVKDIGAGATNDVYGFAIDLDGRKAWIKRNAGNWNADAAANPATGANGVIVAAGSFAPFVGFVSAATSNDSFTANFGASAFVGAVPSGFTAGWPA